MGPKVIKWDGSHVPDELRGLPPGRYAIESVDQVEMLTEEEEAGILAGLTELDAGKGIPLSDVVREIIRGSTTGR
jgi:predicted transcriptional regulator